MLFVFVVFVLNTIVVHAEPTPTGIPPTPLQKASAQFNADHPIMSKIIPVGIALGAPARIAGVTAQPTAQPEQIHCLEYTAGLPSGISIPGCVAIASYEVLYLTSWVLFVAAMAFDWTIQWSLSMYDIINSFQAIQYGWETLRNVINLFFILILVYIAIATILRIEDYGYKKLLSKLVIAAFLINFSMFFTKIIIDASNITAIVFYKQIMIDAKIAGSAGSSGAAGTGAASASQNNYLSLGIMNALGLQSVWGVVNNIKSTTGGAGTAASSATTSMSNNPATISGGIIATTAGSKPVTDPWTMTLVGLGGSVFILILSFVFFATTIMLLLRIVVLILLIITSPAAFAARVLPQTSKWSDKWWSQLTSNALFAPVYMILMFITLKMVWGGNDRVGNNLLSLFTSKDGSGIQVIVFFILLCAMLIACLTVAASFGTLGAKTVSGWGKSMGGKAKDWTRDYAQSRAFAPVSRLADMASKSKFISRVPGVGGMLLQGADKLAQVKVGGSTYRSRIEANKKTYKTRGDLIKNANTGELMRGVNESEATFKERKDRQEKAGRKAQERYFDIDKDGKRQSRFIYKGKSQAREDVMEASGKRNTDKSSEIIKQTTKSMTKIVDSELIDVMKSLGTADIKIIEDHIEKMKKTEGKDATGKNIRVWDDDKTKNEMWSALVEKIEGPIKKVSDEIRKNEQQMYDLAEINKTATKTVREKNAITQESLRAQTDLLKSRLAAANTVKSKFESGIKRVEDIEVQKGTKMAIEKSVPPPATK